MKKYSSWSTYTGWTVTSNQWPASSVVSRGRRSATSAQWDRDASAARDISSSASGPSRSCATNRRAWRSRLRRVSGSGGSLAADSRDEAAHRVSKRMTSDMSRVAIRFGSGASSAVSRRSSSSGRER